MNESLILMDWVLMFALGFLIFMAYLLAGLFSLLALDDRLFELCRPSMIPDNVIGGIWILIAWPLVCLWHGIPALFAWLDKVPE